MSKEWFDRDFMKSYDAQVTVGLSGSIDRKIGFSGSKRLTVDSPRVNVWVVEKSGSVQSTRRIRDKMRQEIKRIVREKRTKPNITEYTLGTLVLFRFKIAAKPDVLTKLELTFEGYGTAPAGNGATIKVWNFTSEAWENAETGTGGADETITISLTSDFADFVDSDGYVYLLVKTTNPSDGSTPAVIY